MKIIFGSDYAGAAQSEILFECLKSFGDVTIVTEGCFFEQDYVQVSKKVSELIQNTNFYGVLLCGTGIGISIVANKHEGVYAARCVTSQDAKNSKLINDANVLCLSATVEIEENKQIIKDFLTTKFSDKPANKNYREDRVKSIRELERCNFR